MVICEESLEHEDGRDVQPPLLGFRAGRQSYGGFNARLEVRLSEIASQQRAVAEQLEKDARDAAAREAADAERTALLARAAEHEAAEKEMGALADAEMAARYSKYVPESSGRPMLPPRAARPVRVLDEPVSSRKGTVRPAAEAGMAAGASAHQAGATLTRAGVPRDGAAHSGAEADTNTGAGGGPAVKLKSKKRRR